jgi:hypothetical protein
MPVEIEVYKAIERLEEKEKVNAMFVKSIVEQVEYMETYGLTVWNLFNAPLKGYKVVDSNNETVMIFRVDYLKRYADYVIKADDDNIIIRICQKNRLLKRDEIKLPITALESRALYVIPLRADEFQEELKIFDNNKIHEI